MENNPHHENLLARWLADELTEEELTQLQQREDFAELESIVNGMDQLDMPTFSEEDSWKSLQDKMAAPAQEEEEGDSETSEEANEQEEQVLEITPLPSSKMEPQEETPPPTAEPPAVKFITRRQWLYAAAAVLLLMVGALLWLRESGPSYENIVMTATGEQQQVTLPDGSTVQLNAESSIGFTEANWPDQREVYLQGEGYFQAKKGKTFTVMTDQGKVRVVGTVFNVYARDQELDVKCTQGKVQVFNPKETEKVLLKAGEQVSVLNGRMQRRRGIDFTPKWFNGESVFRSAPREKVFGELERQYGVVVEYDKKGEASPFSGKFVNNDLEKALKMVAVPMGLQYEIRNDTIQFTPK